VYAVFPVTDDFVLGPLYAELFDDPFVAVADGLFDFAEDVVAVALFSCDILTPEPKAPGLFDIILSKSGVPDTSPSSLRHGRVPPTKPMK